MIDQVIINKIESYTNYSASLKERSISAPKKKSIKETIPFSNEIYDFSAINGELYWEERELEYVFEILEMTPEELEEKKIAFKSWVMNVMKAELHDPFIKDFHFIATFDDIDFDDSEIEKSTITVKFKAYPYMIANEKEQCSVNVNTNSEVTLQIINNSSHRIVPTLISNVPVTLRKSGTTFSMGATTIKDEAFMLQTGVNEILAKATSNNGTLKVEFYEEVF